MIPIRAWLIFLLLSVAIQLPAVAQVAANDQPAPGPAAGNLAAPPWLPLDPARQKHIDDVLNYWEWSTSKVERYRCQFKRWEYETELKTYSEGAIKYAAPDKGLFQVEVFKQAPDWTPQEDGFREHWICDGKSIFEFDYNNKQLKQRPLPPGMQGTQIAEGPLPFLFGAKAAQIKQRFWMSVVTPSDAQAEYWLEAWPKTRDDAANFRMLVIILDQEDFLPKGMKMFHRNGAQTTFAFEQRETNWSLGLSQLNPFLREFFEPKTPSGWKKVVVPLVEQEQPPAQADARGQQGAPKTR
jgi:TIGR03009 family protein